jgi:L-ascorbate metabolism protein UlaG (beta-lactamase superfamily)
VFAFALSGCCALASYHVDPELKSDHLENGHFFNVEPTEHSLGDALRWGFTRTPGRWDDWVEADPGPPPPERVYGSTLRITYINHATVLIQTQGVNILTDPVWSYRVGPLSWVGIRRHRPPGIRYEELPPIDAILISHSHYDHMDLPTLRQLAKDHHATAIVGLGDRDRLIDTGIQDVREMDWWQTETLIEGIQVTAVPARHWTKRSLCDLNGTLWNGYVIHGTFGAVYFAGDTGYGRHIQQIHEHFPNVRAALLPIGAYLPAWFMGPVHLSPDEAVSVHEELGAATTIPIHFGTFEQGDDGQFQPIDALRHAMSEHNPVSFGVTILEFGEGRDIP